MTESADGTNPNHGPAEEDTGLDPNSAVAIQREWEDLPPGYIPADRFAELPVDVRARLRTEARRNTELSKTVETLKDESRQTRELLAALVGKQQQAAPTNGHNNGNGHASSAVDEIAAMSDDELASLRQRAENALMQLAVEPDNEQLRKTVLSDSFRDARARVDREYIRRIAASAAESRVKPLESGERARSVSMALVERLAARHGPPVRDPSNEIHAKAKPIMETLRAQYGVEANNPDHATMNAMVVEMAYDRAALELKAAAGNDTQRRQVASPQPGASRGSPNGRTSEVAALLSQGRKADANLQAFREMLTGAPVNETFRVRH